MSLAELGNSMACARRAAGRSSCVRAGEAGRAVAFNTGYLLLPSGAGRFRRRTSEVDCGSPGGFGAACSWPSGISGGGGCHLRLRAGVVSIADNPVKGSWWPRTWPVCASARPAYRPVLVALLSMVSSCSSLKGGSVFVAERGANLDLALLTRVAPVTSAYTNHLAIPGPRRG